MFKRFVLFCALVALPASSQAVLLGNHQLTLDILGTTNYFEFADFLEHEFPEQGLDWGFRFVDLGDIEYFDPNIGAPDNPLQNRNHIRMSFEGNLDIGARIRSALSPKWGRGQVRGMISGVTKFLESHPPLIPPLKGGGQ